jgi:hypothetical protein
MIEDGSLFRDEEGERAMYRLVASYLQSFSASLEPRAPSASIGPPANAVEPSDATPSREELMSRLRERRQAAQVSSEAELAQTEKLVEELRKFRREQVYLGAKRSWTETAETVCNGLPGPGRKPVRSDSVALDAQRLRRFAAERIVNKALHLAGFTAQETNERNREEAAREAKLLARWGKRIDRLATINPHVWDEPASLLALASHALPPSAEEFTAAAPGERNRIGAPADGTKKKR